VIGLEDNRPVDTGLTELSRRCSANGVRLFVDALSTMTSNAMPMRPGVPSR
jgi:hypothetical protein